MALQLGIKLTIHQFVYRTTYLCTAICISRRFFFSFEDREPKLAPAQVPRLCASGPGLNLSPGRWRTDLDMAISVP